MVGRARPLLDLDGRGGVGDSPPGVDPRSGGPRLERASARIFKKNRMDEVLNKIYLQNIFMNEYNFS